MPCFYAFMHLQISLDTSNSRLELQILNFVGEQLRHLLTLYNGRLPLDKLEAIYNEIFGSHSEIDIKKMEKTFVHTASNVVNFAGNRKWLVWAPNGQPYPAHRKEVQTTPPPDSDQSLKTAPTSEWPSFDAGPSYSSCVETSITTVTQGSDPVPSPLVPSSKKELQWPKFEPISPRADSPVTTTYDDSLVSSVMDRSPPSVIDGPPLMIDNAAPVPTPRKAVPSAKPRVPRQMTTSIVDVNRSDEVILNEQTSLLESADSTDDSPHTLPLLDEVTVDPSPYGFLEKELGPDLMAELISSAHLNENKPLSSENQPDLFDYLDDDIPPPSDPTLDETLEKLTLVSRALARGEPCPKFGTEEEEKKVYLPVCAEPIEPIDYLKTGMNPEEVLEEFKKAKERSGGVLTPSLMDPFLTYFGELSGQAIEQMETEERKKKPKKAPRKKPTMAIRFPGQSTSGNSASQSSNATAISSDNAGNSFLSSSGATLSQNSESGYDISASPPLAKVTSGHLIDFDSVSESQISFGNSSGISPTKLASIRDKSMSDWRPFVLAAVDYSMNREIPPSHSKDSLSESSDSISDNLGVD